MPVLEQKAHYLEEISDLDLIDRMVSGDSDAVLWLLSDICGSALKYLAEVKYQTLGIESAELMSEVYILLHQAEWKALRSFRGRSLDGQSCSLKSYVVCIASRLLWKRMEKCVHEDRKREEFALEKGPAQALDDSNHLHRSDILNTIMQLEDPKDRAVLILYKLNGLDPEEVARQVGIRTENVYTRSSRALKKLRQSFESEKVHHGS